MTFGKNNSFNCILFLLFIAVQSSYIAQEPISYSLNDENGLPSNEVYEVLQDDFGFMWIGCDAGLYRYDGFEYKQYRNSEQNGRAISNLKKDKLGRIWARNFKGQIYCVSGDSLVIVTQQLKTDIAHAFYDLDDKSISWSFRSGILYSIRADGKILTQTPLKLNNKLKSDITSIALMGQTIYLSDRANSIYAYNLKSKTFKELAKDHVHPESNYFFKNGKELFFTSQDSKSNLVSLYKIEGFKCRLIRSFNLTSTNPRLYALCADNKQNVWMCTGNGLGKLSSTFLNFDQLPTILRGKNVSNILQDFEGNYWVTTLQNGIFIIPNLQIIKYDSNNSGLIENNLTALNGYNKNELLIGSYSGKLFHLDLITRHFFEIKLPKELKTVSVKFIRAINNSFYCSHGPLSEIKDLQYKHSYPLYYSKALEVQKGILYYLNADMLGSIPFKELNKTKQFDYIPNKGGKEMIYAPSNATLYYALNSGLFAYKDNEWLEVKYSGKVIHVTGFALYGNSICVTTLTQGLLFIKNNKISHAINSTNSLLENELKAITISESFIWVCGIKNLMRINTKTDEIATFSLYNGIRGSDINALNAAFGTLYLATNKGLISFPENTSWKNTQPPSIRINYLLLDGKVMGSGKHLTLPYNHNKLTVNISSISFKSKGQYTYRYRIQSEDKSWTTLPANVSNIQLTRIPPGKYLFQVQAINENGTLSKTASFPFNVSSPIWNKWWFYLIITIVTIGLFGLVFYSRVRFIQKRADLRNKVTASQLTALKSQMNPHFMFNALNSIQDLVLRNDSKNSNLYLSKFSNLMRKILDASDTEYISLQNELDILKLYLDLEKLRFGTDFVFDITVDENIDAYSLQLPSMIIQPFIENALKHGLLHKKGNKTLQVTFTLETALICVIEDNGIGRKHANEIKIRQANATSSFATEATEKRIDLLNSYSHVNYTFNIIDLLDDGKSIGTRVILTLPLI